jgi:hypothetical protein
MQLLLSPVAQDIWFPSPIILLVIVHGGGIVVTYNSSTYLQILFGNHRLWHCTVGNISAINGTLIDLDVQVAE